MNNLYPMTFQPVLKNYIWGGHQLADYGRSLPGEEAVAESWEIAAHQDGGTLVENGAFAGQSLQQVLDYLRVDLVGKRNQWALDRGKFPLLIKLLDADKCLSVQVHPDDAHAHAHENGELGKAEMWVVLKAKPGAAIVYGFNQKITPGKLRQLLDDGALESYLSKVPIHQGDHICVPPGTVHTIMAGAVIAEIQQNSNVTYRVFDWNRVGEDGKPRDLHIDRALEVINYDQVSYGLSKAEIIEDTLDYLREGLCHNQYFTTERLSFKHGGKYSGSCDGSTMEIWGVLEGEVEIAGSMIRGVKFVLLPASMGAFTVVAQSDSVLLRAYVA